MNCAAAVVSGVLLTLVRVGSRASADAALGDD